MANPIQQGLKRFLGGVERPDRDLPQWLIQYNKD